MTHKDNDTDMSDRDLHRFEHVKHGAQKHGASGKKAEEIAQRTVENHRNESARLSTRRDKGKMNGDDTATTKEKNRNRNSGEE